MKASKIFSEIEKHAPMSLAWEYDYMGLNVGSKNADVNNILVCENVTMATLDEAKKLNCELIISHHPAVFGEELDSYTKDIIKKAKAYKIVLYSAHTNMDATIGGINDKLASLLDIDVKEGFNKCYRLGEFKTIATLKEKKDEISRILKDNNIRTSGNLNRKLKRVCISSGAGARDDDLVEKIKDKNIDVLIGGENKLSLAIKMQYYNICLIEIGHYNSEIICMDIFKEWLKPLDVKIFKSKKDINPYN